VVFLVLGNFNLFNIDIPAEVSLSRKASFEVAKESVKHNPFFGSGPGTFYYDFAKYRGHNFNSNPMWSTRFDNATGLLFELVPTVGSLGALAIIVTILIILSLSFLALIKTAKKEVHSILLACFSSFIAIILFSAIFFISNSLMLVMAIITCFTLVTAINIYPEEFKSINLSLKTSPKYALALAAIFLSVTAGVVVLFTTGIKLYLADVYTKKAFASEDLVSRGSRLERAVALNPYRDIYYLNLANNYMNLANEEVAKENRDQAVVEQYLSQAVSSGKKAIEINPNSVASNESLALVYENASFYTRGALEWAENLYNNMKELDPESPIPYLRIGLINMARANAETDGEEKKFYINEAIKSYNEALAKKNDFGAAFYGKAIAYEQLDNTDEAIEQLKSAVIFTPNNVDYRFELGRLYYNRGTEQAGISQNASKEITEEEITEEGEGEGLSVESGQGGGTIEKNEDLQMAEQTFLSILQYNPAHANALYSLGMLYQKVGEKDNMKIAVERLLQVVNDEASLEIISKQFPGY